MPELSYFHISMLLRLVVAVVCGGLIGWERGGAKHEAGLRTHMIVCLGSASVMVVSECLVMQYQIPGEIMRMSAQIISGIGFLGAGSIIISGNRIRGITTAAGIWTTACIGIAVGAGYYIIGLSVVILMLFTMLGLKTVASNLRNRSLCCTLKLQLADRQALGDALDSLMRQGVGIKRVDAPTGDGALNAEVALVLPDDLEPDLLMCKLISEHKGILQWSTL